MKKLISLILSLILLLSNFTMFEIYGTDTNNEGPSYASGSGTIDDPYEVSSIDDLKEVGENLDKHFLQINDIDLTTVNPLTPIGTSDNPFTGTYNGNEYNISNLEIISTSNNVGLFGYIGTGSAIKNVNLVEPNINISVKYVGSLVGSSSSGSIENCSAINGSITASSIVGGLIGFARSSSITNSFFDGDVKAKFTNESRVGGLLGSTSSHGVPTEINMSYSNSSVVGGKNTGGLVGYNTGIVKNSFSNGSVNGYSYSGGLIGNYSPSTNGDSNIINCYSTSSVDSNDYSPFGGLVGNYNDNKSLILSSFWDSDVFKSYPIDDNYGISTQSIQDENSLVNEGWNFESIWAINDTTNNGYPYLIGLPKQKLKITGDFSVEDKKYDGKEDVDISSENLTLSGILIDGDTYGVKLNPVATFSDSAIEDNKTVALSNSFLTGKYSFLYDIDFEDSPTSSANIYDYANYTKEYYVEPLVDGEYHIHSTSTGSGLVGKTITISAINIDGFTENTNHLGSKIEGEISIDSPLVLKRFYDRNIYKVTFEDFDSSIIDTQQVKYGGNATAPSLSQKEGYEFLKWDSDFTNIHENLKIKSLWKAKDDVLYQVNHYTENLDGNYILDRTENLAGTTNTTVSAAALSLDGFTFNEKDSISSGTIDAEGSLELKLYYDRNIYKVTFEDFDGSIIDAQQVKYRRNAIPPANPYRSGYKFEDWNGNYENIIKDTSIVSKYIRRKSKPVTKNTEEDNKDEILKIEVPSVDGHWSEEAVEELVSRKIIVSHDNFQPEEYISRVEFADYITRALNLYKTNNTYEINFIDINDKYLFSDSIKSAMEHGIIKGYEDKTFRPDQRITRQEAMVMYARALKVLAINFSDFKNIEIYKDFSKIENWAFDEVQIVISAGGFNGTDKNTLSPLSTFKYSEAAESIRNLLYIE